MHRVRILLATGLSFFALIAVGDKVRAQTVLLNSVANGTFSFGDTSFTISGCTFSGGTCGTADNAEVVGVFNGRNGTEIELAPISTSSIFSVVGGAANTTLSFNLQITPKTGSRGLSAIQNVISGSDGRSSENALVSAVLTPGSGVSNATGSGTSNLSTTSSTTNFTLTQNAVNFSVALSDDGHSGTSPDTLKLNNVSLLFTPAPEPASIALFATGLAGLTAARRRWKQRRPAAV